MHNNHFILFIHKLIFTITLTIPNISQIYHFIRDLQLFSMLKNDILLFPELFFTILHKVYVTKTKFEVIILNNSITKISIN